MVIACTFPFGENFPPLYDFSPDFPKSPSFLSSSPPRLLLCSPAVRARDTARRRRVCGSSYERAAMAGGAGGRDPLVASEIHGFLTCAGRLALPPRSSTGFLFTPRLFFFFFFHSVLSGAAILMFWVMHLSFDAVRLSSVACSV